MNVEVGIEKIGVYPLSLALSMRDLCAARGTDPDHVEKNMMVDARAVSPVWEDSVSMGVNAAKPILTPEDLEKVELLLVASESSVDEEKALATWIHRYLGLKSSCRSFETKAACYAGTGSMMMALHWLAHPTTDPGAKALIVMTDQARMHLEKPYEYALGGAATAVLLSRNPRALKVKLGSGTYCTIEREDLIRPDPYVEVGDTELSLISYMEALDLCLDSLAEKKGALHPLEDAKWNLYHAPFGGMTFLGHKALLSRYGTYKKAEARAHFDDRSAPSLKFLRAIGTTYSSSNFIEFLGLFADPRVRAGDVLSVFAYGAGSEAELYFAEVGTDFRGVLAESGLAEKIASRRKITVAEYEAIEKKRHELAPRADMDYRPIFLSDPIYTENYRGRGKLVLSHIEGYHRHYEWS